MKRLSVVFALMIAAGLLVLFVILSGQVQAETLPSCSLNHQISESPNGVTFFPVCSGIQDSWATMQFGDGAEVDLMIAESGEVEPTSHFYAYEVNGLRAYTPTLEVEGFAFSETVVIDDRQVEPSLTVCTLAITQTDLNQFSFLPVCESSKDWLKLDFGDGNSTMFSISEKQVFPHSYAYIPDGVASYTVTIVLNEFSVLTDTVIIDDRDFIPTHQVFLPLAGRNF